jgi:hypothetical protein
MTEPPPDFREEIDIVQIDPLLLERQRNRYASRGIALLILLNGIAALILLAGFSNLAPANQNAGKVVYAMISTILPRLIPHPCSVSTKKDQHALLPAGPMSILTE